MCILVACWGLLLPLRWLETTLMFTIYRPTCLKSCLSLCMMNLVFPILGWLDPQFGHANSMFCDKRERLYLLCVPYSFKFLHLSVCHVLSFSPLDLYILMSCYRMWWNVHLFIFSSRVMNLHLEVYYFTQWRTKTLLGFERVVLMWSLNQ
jgi:hypothetical protein